MNDNKKYSLGCVAICTIIVVTLVVSTKVRDQLGWFWIVLLLIALGCIAFSVFELIGKKFGGFRLGQFFDKFKKAPSKYQKKSQVITDSERAFFLLLSSVIGDKYSIYSQVSLNSIIDKKLQNSFRNELFRTIDFVITDKQTSEPLVLIELNDASHLRADRATRDKKVKEICDIAKIPLVTFWTKDILTVESIKNVLKKYIKL